MCVISVLYTCSHLFFVMNSSDFTKKYLNTDFVGREYAFKAIDKLWTVPAGEPRSMLFWGDWNVGKSEVIWNVDKRFQQINTVYTSLQRLGRDREAKHIWQMLVDEVEHTTDSKAPPDSVLLVNPFTAFSQYVEKVLADRPKYRLLLAIDQYEGFLDIPESAAILQQLEALTLKHDRLAFLLCGSHDIGSDTGKANLEFKPARKLWLGAFAKEETAEYCNQQPYKFDPEAIAHLHELTSGQPWLVRGLCFTIIGEFNIILEESHEVPSSVSIYDVNEIANGDRFYENHRYYFASLWAKRISCGDTTLQQVLLVLADKSDGMTVADIASELGTRRSCEIYEVCQEAILRHTGSLIQEHNKYGTEIYSVAIELFRRWIIRTHK